MRKIHDRIVNIRGNLISVASQEARLGELATIIKKNGESSYASVLSFDHNLATLQVFGNARGISTGDKVIFLGREMTVSYSHDLLGRRFNGGGAPIDRGAEILGEDIPIVTTPFNPVKRMIPREMVHTHIPMIDMFNCLVESQKIPIFSIPGEPYNQLLMRIANQTDADIVIIGGMGLTFDEYQAFIDNVEQAGTSDSTVMFIHQATNPPVECLLVPDMALACAERFALEGKHVLALLSDMTAFANAIKEISITMDQIPSNRGYPGSLYSDLAMRYEKAVAIEGAGSITIVTVTTMPGDDITHPVPDNTGYITEGQFYLRNGSIEPFGSLSRLKQLVIGTCTRADHNDLANTMIRLYADARKAKERSAMGFRLSRWDQKLMTYLQLFETKMMNLEVNIPILAALDLGWTILSECFQPHEVGIKKSLLDAHWPTS